MSINTKLVFPKTLRELRFITPPQLKGGESAVHSFLAKWYPTAKKSNPTTPILIREAHNVQPTLYGRFELGREAKISLNDSSKTTVKKTVEDFINHNQ